LSQTDHTSTDIIEAVHHVSTGIVSSSDICPKNKTKTSPTQYAYKTKRIRLHGMCSCLCYLHCDCPSKSQ